MKRFALFLAAAVVMLASCDPKDPVKVNPTLSITADSSFSEELLANVTLTLSSTAQNDIVVTLTKADVQPGKKSVTAIFDKKATIAKGQKSVVVPVSVDLTGLKTGDYQVAIAIQNAEGVILAETKTVYIDLSFVQKPTVELVADAVFKNTGKANLTVQLSTVADSDITVKLKKETSTLTFNVPETVTIPAGKAYVDVPVTAEIEGLAVGSYTAVVSIESATGAIVSSTMSKVSIGYTYSLVSSIIIDGDFADWESSPNIGTAVLPEKVYSAPDGAKADQLKTIKLGADKQYVYVYFELARQETSPWSLSVAADFYWDADGNPATGYFDGDNIFGSSLFKNMGCEWYNEIGDLILAGEGFRSEYSMYPYRWLKYHGAAGQNLWVGGFDNLAEAEEADHDYALSLTTAAGTYSEGVYYYEARFSRKKLGVTESKVGFGIRLLKDYAQPSIGALPQGSPDASGNYQPAEMLYINVPEIANE